MAKSELVVNYNNNVYQGWWIKFTIIQEEGKLKEVITIDMVQGRLRHLNNFGLSIVEYLYT